MNACDRPERYAQIRKEFEGGLFFPILFPCGSVAKYEASPINVLENGHFVARRSDFIIYSVEAEYIDKVVRQYGPCEFPSGECVE